MAAAVANAIYNATGVRVREYPVTLDKLRVVNLLDLFEIERRYFKHT